MAKRNKNKTTSDYLGNGDDFFKLKEVIQKKGWMRGCVKIIVWSRCSIEVPISQIYPHILIIGRQLTSS